MLLNDAQLAIARQTASMSKADIVTCRQIKCSVDDAIGSPAQSAAAILDTALCLSSKLTQVFRRSNRADG